jgi:hypothetical protein
MNVDLISLKWKYIYKEHEGKHDRIRWTQTSAGHPQILASVDVIEFKTTEAYSNFDLTNVM